VLEQSSSRNGAFGLPSRLRRRERPSSAGGGTRGSGPPADDFDGSDPTHHSPQIPDSPAGFQSREGASFWNYSSENSAEEPPAVSC
jgi:hypothetical protein